MNKELILVCDGKEISYAYNMLHSLKFESEKDKILSKMGAKLSPELYSYDTYKAEAENAESTKLFYGICDKSRSKSALFERFGMSIYELGASCYSLVVSETPLDSNGYSTFITFANAVWDHYYDQEKKYVDSVNVLNRNWLKQSFQPIEVKGLFNRQKTIKKRKQQQYDCLSYLFYLNYLPEIVKQIEGK